MKKWNVVDFDRCSYCFVSQESVKYLFLYCPFVVTIYNQIKQWCTNFNVHMPNLESQSIIYGILPCPPENELVNLLIMLFKKLVFDRRMNYTCRCVTLSTFIYKLKEINKIEYDIVMKKNKLSKHFTNWI